MGEVDVKGFFDHLDHTWWEDMLRVRIDDRAFLKLMRKWLKAGILATDGQVIHPESGTPQGGTVSPVLATAYLHDALDVWFEKVVQAHCRGEALLCRYADDWVCAFRYRDAAERFSRVLPKRLGKCNRQVAPEKTRLLRFSRFSPQHAALHLSGLRVLRDARSARRAARQTAYGSPEAPGRMPADHGMDQAAPAPAGA